MSKQDFKLQSRTTEEEQKKGKFVIKYSGIIASAEKMKPLFFVFTYDYDLHGYKTAENIPNVSFKISSSG